MAKEIVEWMKDAGVPSIIVEKLFIKERISVEEKEILKKFKEQMKAAKKMLDGDIQVVIAVGQDSPYKDLFIGALMRWYMETKQKTGKWLTAKEVLERENLGVEGITAIFGMEYLTPQGIKFVSSAIREFIPQGRVFVLSITSKAVLETTLGAEVVDYISHVSMALNLGIERRKMMEI